MLGKSFMILSVKEGRLIKKKEKNTHFKDRNIFKTYL